MKSKSEKLGRILPWLVLLAAYLFSVGIFAYMGCENLDADMTSEMVLADLLNKEGKLLTTSWYYSTELRVVSAVPVYQLGLLLFDSWQMARTFAVALLLALFVAAYLFLMRSFGLGSPMIYCAAALILPVSVTNMSLLVYGQYYVMYFVLISLMLGIMVRMAKGKISWLVGAPLLFVLGVWGGMHGVRLLMMCAAPLGLTAFMLLFVRMQSCTTLREAVQLPEGKHMMGTLLICAGLCVGYLINTLVLSKIYSFKAYADTLMYDMNWEEVFIQLNYIPRYFGYVNRTNMLSMDGITNAAAFAIVVVSVISVWKLASGKVQLASDERLLVWFTISSVLLGISMNCMTRYSAVMVLFSVSYYLPGVLLLVSMAYMLVDKKPMRIRGMKTVVLLFMTAVFALESAQYIRREFRVDDADYRKTANWLLENGYTNGFASFWNASTLTESTDGQIEVYTYEDWEQPELYQWLQKKEHFEKLPEGEVFVFLDYQERMDGVPLARDENLLCETYNGWIYIYDSAEEVMEIQRNGVMNKE